MKNLKKRVEEYKEQRRRSWRNYKWGKQMPLKEARQIAKELQRDNFDVRIIERDPTNLPFVEEVRVDFGAPFQILYRISYKPAGKAPTITQFHVPAALRPKQIYKLGRGRVLRITPKTPKLRR